MFYYDLHSTSKRQKKTQKGGVAGRGYLFFCDTNQKVYQTNPLPSSKEQVHNF